MPLGMNMVLIAVAELDSAAFELAMVLTQQRLAGNGARFVRSTATSPGITAGKLEPR